MIAKNLIGKYALILATFSIITVAFQHLISSEEFSDDVIRNMLFHTYIPLAFSSLLNVVTALIVQRDIRKHAIKTKYIMVATIFYRPVGVFAFLLYLIFRERFSSSNV
jgi:hypothetical protein